MQAAKQVWSIGLCEFHRRRALTVTVDRCATHLAVWWPYGLAFEFSASLVTHVASSTSFTKQHQRPIERHAMSLMTTIVAVASKLNAVYTFNGNVFPSFQLGTGILAGW